MSPEFLLFRVSMQGCNFSKENVNESNRIESLYPPPQCLAVREKLYSPIGLLKFRTRTIFLVVRWLENLTYSNETVALLAPETQL